MAVGALAVGALALGALAIGRLAIGRARIGRLDIDELGVRKARVAESSNAPANDVTEADLQAFADAWNRHDVEALMTFMAEDCAFESSAGPDVCGTRYSGRDAVRAGFAEVWQTFPDAHWGNARHFVHGDRGVSEWTFTGTRVDGTRVEVHGCDLFTFRNGRIAVKNSYRKSRPAASAAAHRSGSPKT